METIRSWILGATDPEMGVAVYRVRYAYASSDNARDLGHPRTGCYYVSLVTVTPAQRENARRTGVWLERVRPISPGFVTRDELRAWCAGEGEGMNWAALVAPWDRAVTP